MEKNISKKLLAGVCALSAAFILASCDPINAVPTNYNDPIVLDDAGKAIDDDDNKTGKIYDAIATDRNSKIVSDLLEKVAQRRFGTYKDIQDAHTSGDLATYFGKITYKNSEKKDTCVFFRDNDDKDPHGKTVDEVRANRFDIFYKDIMSRINEFFYNEITSGSYNDEDGKFDESKLWFAHYYEFYDLKQLPDGAEWSKFFVTNEITKENAYEKLHDLYSNPEEGKRGYIEEKVFPTILKDKLVEEYVYNNNYSSLGRAYARKVNYIKVSYESDVTIWKMMKNFADAFIVGDNSNNFDLEIIADAIKGYAGIGAFDETDDDRSNKGIIKFDGTEFAYDLLKTTLGGEPIDDGTTSCNGIEVKEADAAHYKLGDVVLVPVGTYYKETKLGQLLVSYQKAIKAEQSGRFPLASEKAELDKFTSSGKSKEYGLREKLISLAKEDYTTDGWFVKNGGLSELPSALRDRLFNINVANTLDDGSLKYETKTPGEGQFPIGSYESDKEGNPLKRMPYIRNVNGRKFVIPAKSQKFDENPYNYLYQDVDGKAFYILLVEEAPSTPKLNLESATSYSKLAETKDIVFKTEEMARAVAKVLGTKDSYIKDAYTEILNGYSFDWYESGLYDHFKSEYPDLDIFDEE